METTGFDRHVEHTRELAVDVPDGRGRAVDGLQALEIVFGAGHGAGFAGAHHDAGRGGADLLFGDVHTHARCGLEQRLLCRRRQFGGVDDHTLGIGQQHAAVGAAQRGFQLVQLHVAGLQQLPVAVQAGVCAAAAHLLEAHRLLRVSLRRAAAHPRLDHRLAHQPRRPRTFFKELLARQ